MIEDIVLLILPDTLMHTQATVYIKSNHAFPIRNHLIDHQRVLFDIHDHHNANGDIEPCAFIHYSDSSIYEKTLLEAMKSPLFMAYHDGQPFNGNMFRPCPMLENPECLRDMVQRSGAHSTDMQSPEDVEKLYEKCHPYAENWLDTADKLWRCSHSCAGCPGHKENE